MRTPMNMVYNFSMRGVVVASLSVAFLLGIKSCGEPYDPAKDVVEEFMEGVKKKEGHEALKLLHPSFRDNLSKEVRIPIQLTETRPSEVLACVLSTIGANIDEVDVKEGRLIGEKTALIKVWVRDKGGIDKLFTFVLVKEDDRWRIADITPYVPQPDKGGE